jgi:hypothetical protein
MTENIQNMSENPTENPPASGKEIVTFIVSQLMCWDGNPDTEGAEVYAPKGFKLDPDLHKGVVIEGDRFVCERKAANAFVKAGCGRIDA